MFNFSTESDQETTNQKKLNLCKICKQKGKISKIVVFLKEDKSFKMVENGLEWVEISGNG